MSDGAGQAGVAVELSGETGEGFGAGVATLGAGGGTTRVACYLRISTDAEHQPFSLGAQETRLGAFVASQPGWEHVKTYTEQFSGAYAERPALDQAPRDARLGRYDILLVYRVDRFARSLKVLVGLLEELDNVGVAFRSATEPIDTSTPTGRCSSNCSACSLSSNGPPSSTASSPA